jgi:hypothetical protein
MSVFSKIFFVATTTVALVSGDDSQKPAYEKLGDKLVGKFGDKLGEKVGDKIHEKFGDHDFSMEGKMFNKTDFNETEYMQNRTKKCNATREALGEVKVLVKPVKEEFNKTNVTVNEVVPVLRKFVAGLKEMDTGLGFNYTKFGEFLEKRELARKEREEKMFDLWVNKTLDAKDKIMTEKNMTQTEFDAWFTDAKANWSLKKFEHHKKKMHHEKHGDKKEHGKKDHDHHSESGEKDEEHEDMEKPSFSFEKEFDAEDEKEFGEGKMWHKKDHHDKVKHDKEHDGEYGEEEEELKADFALLKSLWFGADSEKRDGEHHKDLKDKEDFDKEDFDKEDFDEELHELLKGMDWDEIEMEWAKYNGDFDKKDFDKKDFFDKDDFDKEDFDKEDFDKEDFDKEDFDKEDFDKDEDFDDDFVGVEVEAKQGWSWWSTKDSTDTKKTQVAKDTETKSRTATTGFMGKTKKSKSSYTSSGSFDKKKPAKTSTETKDKEAGEKTKDKESGLMKKKPMSKPKPTKMGEKSGEEWEKNDEKKPMSKPKRPTEMGGEKSGEDWEKSNEKKPMSKSRPAPSEEKMGENKSEVDFEKSEEWQQKSKNSNSFDKDEDMWSKDKEGMDKFGRGGFDGDKKKPHMGDRMKDMREHVKGGKHSKKPSGHHGKEHHGKKRMMRIPPTVRLALSLERLYLSKRLWTVEHLKKAVSIRFHHFIREMMGLIKHLCSAKVGLPKNFGDKLREGGKKPFGDKVKNGLGRGGIKKPIRVFGRPAEAQTVVPPGTLAVEATIKTEVRVPEGVTETTLQTDTGFIEATETSLAESIDVDVGNVQVTWIDMKTVSSSTSGSSTLRGLQSTKSEDVNKDTIKVEVETGFVVQTDSADKVKTIGEKIKDPATMKRYHSKQSEKFAEKADLEGAPVWMKNMELGDKDPEAMQVVEHDTEKLESAPTASTSSRASNYGAQVARSSADSESEGRPAAYNQQAEGRSSDSSRESEARGRFEDRPASTNSAASSNVLIALMVVAGAALLF